MSSKGIAGLLLAGLLSVSGAVSFSPSPVLALEPSTSVCLKTAYLLPTLRQKTPKQEVVRDLQNFLINRGHLLALLEDEYGTLGKKTRLAIAAFQKTQGLEPVGTVGTKTAALIQKISCPGPGTEAETSSSSSTGTNLSPRTSTIDASGSVAPVTEPTPP